MSNPVNTEHNLNFVMHAVDRLVVSKVVGASVATYGCIHLALNSVGAGYKKITQGEYDNTGIKQSFEMIKEGGKIAFPLFREQFNSTEEFLDAAGHEPYLATITGLYRIASATYIYFSRQS